MKKNNISGSHLFTSEAVSCGHPDKLADQLSDAILDAYLAQDAEARVASEILVTTDFACLGGEYRTHARVEIEPLVRKTIAAIGYKDGVNEGFDAATVQVLNKMHEQSPEIAQGVDAGARASEGAGDQGLMFGFACDETPELMPAPIHYAQAVLRELEALRRKGLKGQGALLLPDAKSQITVEYRDGAPVRAHTLLVSHQHVAEARQEDLARLVAVAWQNVLPEGWIDAETRILVNPTGSFHLGDRPQDYCGYLRWLRPPWWRGVFRKRPHQGRPLGRLCRTLSGQERGGGGAGAAVRNPAWVRHWYCRTAVHLCGNLRHVGVALL